MLTEFMVFDKIKEIFTSLAETDVYSDSFIYVSDHQNPIFGNSVINMLITVFDGSGLCIQGIIPDRLIYIE